MAFEPEVPPIQVHLCVKGGKAAIAFYEKAFGMAVQKRLDNGANLEVILTTPGGMDLALGGRGAVSFVPSSLEGLYGSRTPVGGAVYLRLGLSR